MATSDPKGHRQAGFSPAQIERLRGLRAQYLARSEEGAPGPLAAGWQDEEELALYDETFGARIGWKWDAVLAEVRLRRVEPPRGRVLDWGSGSGVAARAFLAAFGAEGRSVAVWDASPLARAFAARSLRERWPGLDVVELAAPPAPEAAPEVLLASHVIGELEDAPLAALVELARASRFTAWVEPGSRAIARRLSAARDALRADLAVLAPCAHQAACGVLAEGRERDWCHHVAPPPREAFTTRRWTQFSRELGVDLRSLPFSFLVLGRGERPAERDDVVRLLGRPHLEKGKAEALACTRAGLVELRLLERLDKAFVRGLAHPPDAPRLLRVEARGPRVDAFEPWLPAAPWRPAERG